MQQKKQKKKKKKKKKVSGGPSRFGPRFQNAATKKRSGGNLEMETESKPCCGPGRKLVIAKHHRKTIKKKEKEEKNKKTKGKREKEKIKAKKSTKIAQKPYFAIGTVKR